MAETKFDEVAAQVAVRIGVKEIPWFRLTLWLTGFYTLVSLLSLLGNRMEFLNVSPISNFVLATDSRDCHIHADQHQGSELEQIPMARSRNPSLHHPRHAVALPRSFLARYICVEAVRERNSCNLVPYKVAHGASLLEGQSRL